MRALLRVKRHDKGMSKDKLTDHPDDVVVVAGIKTVRSKPSVARSGAASDQPKQVFRGRPPGSDNDVVQVCRILREALNDRGNTWGAFSAPSVSGANATATNDSGDVLRVHVTRVDRPAAKTLERGDPVIRRRSVGQRVTDIRVAVDSSARQHTASQRGELCLALDTLRSPGHVDGKVVEAFLAAHQTYVAGLGYRAIWLVGPTGEMSREVG